ncbi:glycosyltransferase family 4 protein [Latilactobacillus graminis]|uniref:Glycosyl transferases group 1 family protein n=2 Tax=Latilactobacillus graminis TaxID=60519 RepID=A0AA89I3J1_9LACO|nr:glycosyltransferase family 4 protein [Latilactobacillus graminis]KRM20961.1 glycosyl transferases group 1 family protein [Latilactobacillus graminis DSM 20719]QFP79102.1 glycosyltransferase family 4 protein [Latilactobacillus graminis]
MIKLLFLGTKSTDDQLAWSGTMYQMTQAIKNDDRYSVSALKVPGVSNLDKIRNKWLAVQRKIFSPSKPYISNIDIRQARLNGERLTKLLAKETQKNPVDIIFAPAMSTYMMGLKTDIPIIYLSDATFATMNNYYWFGLSKKDVENGNRVEQAAQAIATACVFSSSWAADSARNDYQTSENKVNVLPFGANLQITESVEPKQIDLTKTIKVLLVGTDYHRKGVDIAEQVIQRLNEKTNIHYELIVVGVTRPDTKFTHFVGLLDKGKQADYDELIQYYQESSLFLLPTKAEAAGIVFAEASMFGLPTLTFDTGGIGEYILNDINGYRIPLDSQNIIASFADKIDEVITDEELYNRLSVGALEQYRKRLNWNQWLTDFNKIVDHVLTKESDK